MRRQTGMVLLVLCGCLGWMLMPLAKPVAEQLDKAVAEQVRPGTEPGTESGTEPGTERFAKAVAASAEKSRGEARLVKMVMLARHGVRSPTQSSKTLQQWTEKAWPVWPVKRGDLTPRGADLIRAQWAQEREDMAQRGLLPEKGCPPAGAIYTYADVDQRTRATAAALLEGFAPGCGLGFVVREEAGADPLFHPLKGENLPAYDVQALRRQLAREMDGGPARLRASLAEALRLLGEIAGPCPPETCSRHGLPKGCTVADLPAPLRLEARKASLGGLSSASDMVEIFLLEYAEWPGKNAAWGEVDAAVLEKLMPIHARVSTLLRGSPGLAELGGGPLLRAMTQALAARHPHAAANEASLVIFVGHDTNITALAGLLGLTWHLPPYARNQVPPGAVLALGLWEDEAKNRTVRAYFMAPALAWLHQAAIRPAPLLQSAVPFTAPGLGDEKAVAWELPLVDFEALALRRLSRNGLQAMDEK